MEQVPGGGTAALRAPLSIGQEQLWFIEHLAPGRPTYNVYVMHRILGPLDINALRISLTRSVNRHESLRATVHEADGAPYLLIAPAAEVELPVIDLSALRRGGGEGGKAAIKAVYEHATAPFDLANGPLYRFTVFRLGPQEHVISRVFHHLVTDGWSGGLLNAELVDDYAAATKDAVLSAGPPPPSYADYARQQRDRLHNGDLEPQLRYWQKQLQGLPVLDLPADRPRPAEQSRPGGSVVADLPASVLDSARQLARQEGASLFMVLTAALAVLLGRYAGQQDIAIGTAMPGRTDPEQERIVGYFVNMVVLRIALADDPSFSALIEQVADIVMDAYDNQDVPFERVVDRLQPVRDPGRNPLFGVCVQLLGEQTSGASLELAGLQVESVDPPIVSARFDLALNFVESAERTRLMVEYSLDLFEPWRIEALVRHFERVLAAACANPLLQISQIPLMSDAETDEVLAAGRGELLRYDDEPVHAVIARRAAEQPEHVAARWKGDELSYRELDQRADVIARFLQSQGVRHEQIVAVSVERDLDALTALLGVLKAGAAFAVLDPDLPPARLDYMLRDTGASVLLTQARIRDRLPASGAWRIVALDGDWAAIESAAATVATLEERAGRDSLAYVLYTSGSTGQPKGVLIEHRALMSFIESYRGVFDLGPQDRMLQLAALAFDMSEGEIMAGLCAGATLVLVDVDAGTSPEALSTLMRSAQVSYACLSPAMMSLLEAGPYPELRKIMAGGEAVPGEVVNKWNLPGRRLINCYGPTEAAVGCTSYECPHLQWRSAPPIGTPFPDRRMYVVDKSGQLVPRGISGELLIGGAEGLARGYLNQPELTAALFTDDPFVPGGRVYRSGDLVRWNRDYQLEFLGRIDTQVKLHGLRIELEEIESALLARPEVAMAAVTLYPDQRGDQQLVGYVTPAGDRRPEPAELRRQLSEWLPQYMIPVAWVVLDRLPLTTARKVNRAALPPPALPDLAETTAPATPGEQKIAEIFAAILDVESVDASTAFFDMGGNSLQAMRAVSRLNQAFGVELRLRTMFKNASVQSLAALIDEMREDAEGRKEPGDDS